MNIIEIKNLYKSYGEISVLKDFSLCIKEGTSTCIMGNSGSGKTTLLRIIAGLEKAERGEVIKNFKKLSYVFQEDRLCEDFSPVSNIRFTAGSDIKEEKIISCLNAVGLYENLDKPVKMMSGGMKRRVAIVRALMTDFDVLIMDEPFKGLDLQLKESVIEYIKEKTKGKALIVVTHEKAEAKLLTDNIVTM